MQGDRLCEHAGELPVIHHQVVRPLETRVHPCDVPARIGRRQGNGEGERMRAGCRPRIADRVGAQEDRHEEIRPGRGLPAPSETSPSRGLVLRYRDKAVRCSSRASSARYLLVESISSKRRTGPRRGRESLRDMRQPYGRASLVDRAREGSDRQPRRDRGAGHPHLPRARHPDRGRLLGARPRRDARPDGGRGLRTRRSHRS